MTETTEKPEIPVESVRAEVPHAAQENSVADAEKQQHWSAANADTHRDDKTPSRLDMTAASSPLELVDTTSTGSQKVILSTAVSSSPAPESKPIGFERSLAPVTHDHLEVLAKTDIVAAGYLRDLNATSQIVDTAERARQEKQILNLATQTYGRTESHSSSLESPKVDTLVLEKTSSLDTQQIKILAAENEAASATLQMLNSLDESNLSNGEKLRLRTELKSSFTDVRDMGKPADDGASDDKIIEKTPKNLDSKTFALGLEYRDIPASNHLADKLCVFAQSAYQRAATGLTDQEAVEVYWRSQGEKLVGIGEGLNEAKEGVKTAARTLWNAAADGTIARAIMNIGAICDPIAQAADVALQKMSEDPEAVNKALASALGAAGVKSLELNEKYSSLTPREQGKVIGEVMFAFVNPEGTLEAPELIGKATARSDEAIVAALQAAMKSGTAQEIRANLEVMRDLARSPELKQFLLDGFGGEGLQPALAGNAPSEMLSTNVGHETTFAMTMWDDLKSTIGRQLRGTADEFDKDFSVSDIVKSHIEIGKILKLEGDAFINRAIDHMVQPIEKESEAFQHWAEMKGALKTIPEVDLRELLKNNHRFYFPQRLTDDFPKAASLTDEFLGSEYSDFAGLTIPSLKITIVPRYRSIGMNEFVENAEDYVLSGVVRHEVGQVLSSKEKWTQIDEVFDLYRKESILLRTELRKIDRGFIAAGKENDAEILLQLRNHLLESKFYGFEQTITDLYAIEHGGCGLSKDIERFLKVRFSELLEHMRSNNWYRNH